MGAAFIDSIGLPEAILLLVLFGIVAVLIGGLVAGLICLVNYLRRPKIAPPPQAAAGEKKEPEI